VRKENQIYLSDLAGLGVAGTLHLVGASLGETNAEHAEHVVVSSLHVHMSLNQRLPFPHKRPELVSGEVHALENKNNWLVKQIYKNSSNSMKV
jgi:hypothetical protein